jgi:hypothetical protein
MRVHTVRHTMKMVPKNVIPAEAGIQKDAMECVPPKVYFRRSTNHDPDSGD